MGWPKVIAIPNGRLVAAFVIVVTLATSHWKVYTVGRNGEQIKAAQLKQAQQFELANFNEVERLRERGWQAQNQKAQNERIAKNQTAQAIVVAVRSELDGLRGDIYRIDTDSGGQSFSACPARAATARDLLQQCIAQYSSVARAADGHAADSLMYQQAWPK